MSSSHYPYEDRVTTGRGYQYLWPDESSYTLGTYITTFLTTTFILFKALEFLGYPVWLWVYQVLEMAKRVLSNSLNKDPSSGTDSDGSSLDMQSGGAKVLSSVFGLNNGLLGKSMRGVTGALGKSYTSSAPAGLGNWDNSCYQNSVIQGMAALPSLTDYLTATTAEHPKLDPETSTSGALFDMLSRLNNPDNQGRHFMIRGKLKSMSTWQQQDAQEYYSKILDELDIEVQKASNAKRQSSASWLLTAKSLGGSPEATEEKPDAIPVEEKSDAIFVEEQSTEDATTLPAQPKITPNPLDGLLAQRVGCINCGYTEGLSMIPFNCITVPLEGGRNRQYDVRDCLDEYTKLEYIEGVECAKCTLLKTKQVLEKLQLTSRLQAVNEALEEDNFDDKTLKSCGITKKNWVQTTKSRQAIISRAPKALVLHVNRSIFDEMTGAQLKNDAPVRYPQALDLGYWCLGSRPSETHNLDDAIEERWPKDPRASMLPEMKSETEMFGSPFQYKLRAAVTHFGSHGNGHYVCYRQKPPGKSDGHTIKATDETNTEPTNQQWWRFSDENVTEVPEHVALNQSGVFMLFYERVEHTPGSPSLDGDTAKPAIIPIAEELQDLNAIVLDEEPLDTEPITTALPEHGSEASPSSSKSDFPPPDVSVISLSSQDDIEISEADAAQSDTDDALTTLASTDDEMDTMPEGEAWNPQPFIPTHSPGPHMMRTAGSGPSSGDESRTSLPMVRV